MPSSYQILLKQSSIRTRRFPALRYLQQAGGHLADSYVQELQNILPGVPFYRMYGQTEATARLSFLAPDLLAKKKVSIGKAIPGVTLQVLSESGAPVVPGQVGEIVASGDNISPGYWKDPEATRQKFRNGKLYTGDLAAIDEEGFISIVGRANDLLKCGGQRAHAREVEEIVEQHPDVLEAAVISTPDDILGEAVKLFVVPSRCNQALVQELMDLCAAALPDHLHPKMIIVMESLPRNAAGKIQKEELRNLEGESL